MSVTGYELPEALIYDPVATNRNASRASLLAVGFRNVEVAASFDIMIKRIKDRAPDLILCEATGAEAEVCKLVQSIRQGHLGENPFIVIIVTTWRRDGDLVGLVVHSGADDLLARPFSAVQLKERLRSHIERRKGFIVTTEYIGPDRRRDPDRPGCPAFEVPNSLKIRITEGAGGEEVERFVAQTIRQGRDLVNREKLRRDAFQLCVQWRKIEQRPPDADDFVSTLDRIEELATEISRRAEEGGIVDVKKSCEAIFEATALIRVRRLETAANPVAPPDIAAPLHVLGEAALNLGRILAPGEVSTAQLVELDAIVAKIDAKTQLPQTKSKSAPPYAGSERRAASATS